MKHAVSYRGKGRGNGVKGQHPLSSTHNTELNELRKIIGLRKSEVSIERISICNVTKNLAEMAYTVCHAPTPMTSCHVML